jgi:hypothetical protein
MPKLYALFTVAKRGEVSSPMKNARVENYRGSSFDLRALGWKKESLNLSGMEPQPTG